MQLDTLVRMGRQTARNNAVLPHEEAVARIAGHLKAFWTPAMLEEIQAYAMTEPADLDPLLTDALRTLRARSRRGSPN